MNNQYVYANTKDAEFWGSDTFDTFKECVKEYLACKNFDVPLEYIYVGEVTPYDVQIDGTQVIERLEEEANGECGECAENWDALFVDSESDWNDLDEALAKVVKDWLSKRNNLPTFGQVTNIREVKVSDYDIKKVE